MNQILFLTALMLFITTNLAAQSSAFKKPSKDQLKKSLTAIQYEVTQENGTESPFKNDYWNHHEDGIYVDVVSGEALFSSLDKYDSGTGWPSFSRPIADSSIVKREETVRYSVYVRKCVPKLLIHIWAMSLRMVQNQPGYAIV